MSLKINDDSFLLNGKVIAVFNKGASVGKPCEIIDNTLFDGKYVSCLEYLSENIRIHYDYIPSDSISYLSKFFNAKFEYNLFEYKHEDLSRSRIINDLHHVLYLLSPRLSSHTCCGWTSGLVEDDPNRYEGSYILNDGKKYTIQKIYDKYKFSIDGDVIYENVLCWEYYKKALELKRIRNEMVIGINRLIDNGKLESNLVEYESIKKDIFLFLETLNFLLTFKKNDDIL